MAKLSAIREGLAANLAPLQDAQVSAYMLAAPTPPCIHVYPDEITYDRAMGRGEDDWQLVVHGFVGLTSDVGAQKRLDRWLASTGAESVKALIETDRTLDGACDDLFVQTCSGYRVYQLEGRPPTLGAEWTVLVIAKGA